MRRKRLCSVCLPLLSQARSSCCGGITFLVLEPTDQLRHPALWIVQLLDSWPFYQKTAIVGLTQEQKVSHSDKSLFSYVDACCQFRSSKDTQPIYLASVRVHNLQYRKKIHTKGPSPGRDGVSIPHPTSPLNAAMKLRTL